MAELGTWGLLARLAVLAAVAAAVAAQERAKDGGIPRNLHLAVTGDPTEMVVSWLTDDDTDSACWYGETTTENQSDGGTSSSYSKKSGWNHNVKLTGLKPATEYVYICGDEVHGVSSRHSFRTEDRGGAEGMVYGILGDMGITNSEQVVQRVNQHGAAGRWEIMWHLGDISYANDHPWLYEHTWNKWFGSLQPLMTQVPYMVLPGNHESWSRNPFYDPGTFNFSSYEHKFRMPGWESGTNTSLYHSFDYGLVHFISIDTEGNYAGAPVDPGPYYPPSLDKATSSGYFQMDWLEADLQKAVANRANVPWIVVGGHRNVYNVNAQKGGKPVQHDKSLQAWLEPLFQKYDVDVFFTGHAHNYQRMWPTLNNVVQQKSYVNPTATTYIIHGCAGNLEGHEHFVDSSEWPDWFATGDDENYGYAEMTVLNATHIRWTAFRADTDAVVDDLVLSRQR